MSSKIKKGDNVMVITGKDKGKTGEVLSVLPAKQRVLVRGVNIVKRHTKKKNKYLIDFKSLVLLLLLLLLSQGSQEYAY